jgi:uncharacterized membrane protein
MSISTTIQTVLKSSLVFLLLDGIYLYSMRKYFNDQVKIIQGSPVRLNTFGTILTYVFLLFGLNYFILSPKKSVFDAFLFGLVIYAVYEFTTYSLFSGWKCTTVAMDTLWGGILFSLTTYIVYRLG